MHKMARVAALLASRASHVALRQGRAMLPDMEAALGAAEAASSGCRRGGGTDGIVQAVMEVVSSCNTAQLGDLLSALGVSVSFGRTWQLLLEDKSCQQDERGRAALLDLRSSALRNAGKYADAQPLAKESLELRRKVLGEEHPDTISSTNNLAGCINHQGRYAEAEPMYRQALELQRKVLGEEHPDTIRSTNNLANCIKRQGR